MKKVLIIFIVLIIINLIVISIGIRSVNAYSTNEQTYALLITEKDKEIYNNTMEKVECKYNVLLVQMDTVLSNIFKDYDINNQEQILQYKDITLEVDKNKNIIKVPNIYTLENSLVNDSVDVEIEEIGGEKYIPIYLISNIPSVEVVIDGKKIYDKLNYCNSLDALDKQILEHNIIIKLGKEQEEEQKSNNSYIREEDGVLWREEAYKRIEKYRKNDINIIVKNQNNHILNDAIVNLKMNNNEFKFGTAVRYRSWNMKNVYDGITRKLFNGALSENALKWRILNDEGNTLAKDVINFAKENDMYLRGHCLWWDYAVADTLKLVGNRDNANEGTMAYVYEKYKSGEINESEANELIIKLRKAFEDIVLQHIENEVKEFPEIEEWDVVNEPISKQYFKYYLYDKRLLSDDAFLNTTQKNLRKYEDNEDYYKFLSKCFDRARENNKTSKLILNTGYVDGDFSNSLVNDTIRIINNIRKNTNNIDGIGIQNHVNNKYQNTPQSYYNQINFLLEQTKLNEAIITEYDNYQSEKSNNYTSEENKKRAKYLKDTLIAQYSNKNVSGFYFWVYNSTSGSIVEEERQVYEELMKEWLNDEQNGMTDNNGEYSTRAYKGEYTAKVKINELETEVPIKVNDNLEPIEIIINSNLQKISVKQKPTKTEYIQDEEYFNADGGVILAHYDDGTVEEINMNSSDVKISYLDNSILGKQTMTVTYEDKKVTFVVDVIERDLEDVKIKNKIVHKNDNILGIKVDQLPEKIEYVQNEEDIKLEGGKILVTYDDETTKEISMNNKNVSISGFDNSILGEKAIRASYEGKETTFVVDVIEDKSKSDTTMATTILPKAGVKIATLTVIFIVAVVGTIYGKKYIQYLKDTHKQLK